ncbi:NADH:flavin oxidoreductase/NADH oxidase family protein [soil metagenome]
MPALDDPLQLPCGVVLKNRLAKSAMSDSLGDGGGDPTPEQVELYRRWARGGASLLIIGEVQVDPAYPEKPGNLVLSRHSNTARLRQLAAAGEEHDAHIWPQLGHAGALAHPPISSPAGPSALSIEDVHCDALSVAAVEALPSLYAAAARRVQNVGFTGVQVHAGHGFLLSQFLSPLFNHRIDRYGGDVLGRSQVLIDVVRAIRAEVGQDFAIAVKINTSDQLDGGLTEDDALVVVARLGEASIDLLDLSGGTYFPGATPSSDRGPTGPYFVDFATRARRVTDTPLMVTGGFKRRVHVVHALSSGAADVIGLARAMVLDPDTPAQWLAGGGDPTFPHFNSPPPGGVSAWYTMRLTALASYQDVDFDPSIDEALAVYEARDEARTGTWLRAFTMPG